MWEGSEGVIYGRDQLGGAVWVGSKGATSCCLPGKDGAGHQSGKGKGPYGRDQMGGALRVAKERGHVMGGERGPRGWEGKGGHEGGKGKGP